METASELFSQAGVRVGAGIAQIRQLRSHVLGNLLNFGTLEPFEASEPPERLEVTNAYSWMDPGCSEPVIVVGTAY